MNEIINYEDDPRGMVTAANGVTTDMMISRQAQEVQAAIVIAKKFPRNEVTAFNRCVNACKRRRLAENAIYEYQRGSTMVSGPSIRLAEALAQNWGNIDFGITELERKQGESVAMAYAWDLETNTRQTKIFTVKHWRDSRKGGYEVTEQRDIYEVVANHGARRLRSCILGVIPGDVIDAAVEQCNKTLVDSAGGVPVIDMVRGLTKRFQEDFGVTLLMLERYVGCKSESFTVTQCSRLKKIYNSLKDGMAKPEEIFDMNASADDGTPIDAFAGQKKKESQPEKKAESGKKSAGGGKKQQPVKEEPKPEPVQEPEQEDFDQFEMFMNSAGTDDDGLPFR